MLTETFLNYYPHEFRVSATIVNDYITDFEDNNFGDKYGPYLSQNKINVLTPGKSPWIDLGDLPATYNKYQSEDK